MEAILVTILACLLSLEWMNGHFGFSRPLVAATLVGLVLGDVKTGVTLGVSLQLIFMGISGVGAAVPPDQVIGSVIATAFAILTKQDVEVVLALAIPVAVGAQALDIFGRTLTTGLIHIADREVENRNYDMVSRVHLMGALITIVRTAVIVFPAIYFGVDAVEGFINAIPDFVLTGLKVSGGILPAVGFGMLLTMLDIKHLLPFFFIGFSFATFGGFSIVGVTFVAVCFALLYDHLKNHGQHPTSNGEPLDELDELMMD